MRRMGPRHVNAATPDVTSGFRGRSCVASVCGVRPSSAGRPVKRANAGGGDRADALARMRDLSDYARIPDRRDGERGSASTAARRLWEALCQARNEQQPLTQARFEDAVFGFYLPRA